MACEIGVPVEAGIEKLELVSPRLRHDVRNATRLLPVLSLEAAPLQLEALDGILIHVQTEGAGHGVVNGSAVQAKPVLSDAAAPDVVLSQTEPGIVAHTGEEGQDLLIPAGDERHVVDVVRIQDASVRSDVSLN